MLRFLALVSALVVGTLSVATADEPKPAQNERPSEFLGQRAGQ